MGPKSQLQKTVELQKYHFWLILRGQFHRNSAQILMAMGPGLVGKEKGIHGAHQCHGTHLGWSLKPPGIDATTGYIHEKYQVFIFIYMVISDFMGMVVCIIYNIIIYYIHLIGVYHRTLAVKMVMTQSMVISWCMMLSRVHETWGVKVPFSV